MASITTAVLDAPAYAPGATVTLTVDYIADTPGVTTQVSNITVTLSDAAGNVLATAPVPLTVSIPQAGDKITVADDGNRTWTLVSDNGSAAVYSTTA